MRLGRASSGGFSGGILYTVIGWNQHRHRRHLTYDGILRSYPTQPSIGKLRQQLLEVSKAIST